jgi:uncharacterized protein
MSLVFVALSIMVLAYCVFAVAMFKGQHRLIYRMDTSRIAPQRAGLTDVEEVTLATPDGERLIAWYGEPRVGQPTILYFHGQAGALARRSDRVRRYRAAGLGVLFVAYRGFSGSTGTPGEAVNVADGLLAFDWLTTRGVSTKDIVVYGESLGTGVATQVAAQRQVSGLVLDSPFTALSELAAARHPYLPVKRFIFDRYDTLAHIAKSAAPVLVLHGEQDPIVPLAMGLQVFEAAPGPKRMVTFAQGRHLDHGRYGSLDVVLRFLAERARLPKGLSKVERIVPAQAAETTAALPAGAQTAARAA